MMLSETHKDHDYAALWLNDAGCASALLRCVLGALSPARAATAHVLALGQQNPLSPVAAGLSATLSQRGLLTMLATPTLALPLPSGSQDVVWSHHLMLEDEASIGLIFKEILRVLRPGGRAIFCEPEHVYIGRLPRSRLLDLSTGLARLRAAPQEADMAEASLGYGRALWRCALQVFGDVHLTPVSAARVGPFSEADAQVLARVLPSLGLEAPDEDRAVSAFHPKSPFYLLDQPDVLLVQSDWLVCARAPHAA